MLLPSILRFKHVDSVERHRYPLSTFFTNIYIIFIQVLPAEAILDRNIITSSGDGCTELQPYHMHQV
jgi:hypothetical protein